MEQVKASMKAYLASRGVEEVSKLGLIVGYLWCNIFYNIVCPTQLELWSGTLEAEIAKKEYFSTVAKDIVEKVIYGTLNAAHRFFCLISC